MPVIRYSANTVRVVSRIKTDPLHQSPWVQPALARLTACLPLSRIGVIGPFHDRRNPATG